MKEAGYDVITASVAHWERNSLHLFSTNDLCETLLSLVLVLFVFYPFMLVGWLCEDFCLLDCVGCWFVLSDWLLDCVGCWFVLLDFCILLGWRSFMFFHGDVCSSVSCCVLGTGQGPALFVQVQPVYLSETPDP